MLTLEDFSKKILRPSILNMMGLPDTIEGNRVLDLLVALSIQNDRIQEVIDSEKRVWGLKLLYNNPPYGWPKDWPFPLPKGEIAKRNSVTGKWIRGYRVKEEYDDWEKHS